MENIFNGTLRTYGENWQVTNERSFTEAECNAVSRAVVTEGVLPSGDVKKSVCFTLVSGGTNYIPLGRNSESYPVGYQVDMKSCKLLTLFRKGDGNILRVEIAKA